MVVQMGSRSGEGSLRCLCALTGVRKGWSGVAECIDWQVGLFFVKGAYPCFCR